MTMVITDNNAVTAQAISLLFREMGAAKTMKFLSEISGGRGDYTKEKQESSENLTVDEVVALIEKNRADRRETR